MAKTHILAIDIGSHKICAAVAEIGSNGALSVLGVGVKESQGVKKGMINNIDHASLAAHSAINEAIRMAGVEVKKAIISIPSNYTISMDSKGIVNLPHGEIRLTDIQRAMQTAIHNNPVPQDHQLIHALPYRFIIDDMQVAIEDPINMSAHRLECLVYMVTAKKSHLENLKKVIKNCEIEISDIVVSSYASSIATISDDERKGGVACIDIGGGLCDIMIHNGQSMCYSDYLNVGSNNITLDLAQVFNLPLGVSEEIKTKYGNLILTQEDQEKGLSAPIKGMAEKQPIPMESILSVLKARVDETLELLNDILEKSALKNLLTSGIVLTGGMVKLKNFEQYINQSGCFYGLSIRIAQPKQLSGIFEKLQGPEYATIIGLILHNAGRFTNYEVGINNEVKFKKLQTHQGIEEVTLKQEKVVSNVQNLQIKEQIVPKEMYRTDDLDTSTKESTSLFKRFYKWLTQLF